MRFETTDRALSHLIAQIDGGEVKLPEVQRGYVWKPAQVAAFIDSLYRGYPIGSLLFWKADVVPRTREVDIDASPGAGMSPLYLLDGQQRLTSLHRVFNDHPSAQIVFNVGTEKFQNQSSATAKDARWVKAHDVVNGEYDEFQLPVDLAAHFPDLEPREIAKRLRQLAKVKERLVHMEVLGDFDYHEVSEIFIRINSGRPLKRMDLALATLSARRPGTLAELEEEARYWAERGWGDLDIAFLARALTAAVLGRGLTPASNSQLLGKTDEELDAGWATVRRGLRHLVPLLKENLGATHSSLLTSYVVLLPLVVLLGERPDEAMDAETANGVLYWFLTATLRNRYSGSTDTKLGQDIPAARSADGVRRLLGGLQLPDGRLTVAVQDLASRTEQSPYFMLSFLAAKAGDAHDWWSGAAISVAAEGGHKLEYHHIFPQAALRKSGIEFSKTEINDIANLAFIAGKANRKISARRPGEYLETLGLSVSELKAHCIPADPALWEIEQYRGFLAERRALLARSMNAFLDRFRPEQLVQEGSDTDPLAGIKVDFTYCVPEGGEDQLHIEAIVDGSRWEGVCGIPEIHSAIQEAALGLRSEIDISGSMAAVELDDDQIRIAMGPVRVNGTVQQWEQTLHRIEDAIQYLDRPIAAVKTTVSSEASLNFPVVDVV